PGRPHSPSEQRLRVFDLSTGAERLERAIRDAAGGTVISPHGERLVRLSERADSTEMATATVELSRTGRRLRVIPTTFSPDQISPDGRILVMIEYRDRATTKGSPEAAPEQLVHLLDLVSGQVIATLPPKTSYWREGQLEFSPDSRCLAMAAGHCI